MKTNITASMQTIGLDEGAFAMKITQYHKNEKPIKAILGKRDIKFKRPILQWEQKMGKVNL